tara:strand:+ start:3447 stop:3689 length:243 start_codon:yes stop_codon:yes gene_type:complete
MSNNTDWDANDFSNVITISAAAIGSVLLIVFKSRCKEINCCYLVKCKRDVISDEDSDEKIIPPNMPPVPNIKKIQGEESA